MLIQQLKHTLAEYKSIRPDPKIKDPIALAVAVRDARKIRDELKLFIDIVRRDEAHYLARFSSETSCEDVHSPSRFAPVPRSSTIIDTLREFVRRNQGEEFTTVDVVEACDLHGTPIASVRGLLARMREQGEIRRPQRGVYKALPRKRQNREQTSNAK